MKYTYLISDLHLCEAHTDGLQLFKQFIQQQLDDAEALYILGDFFEAWAGDDDLTPFHLEIIQLLKSLSARGIAVYLMHGNRDFLLGAQFAERAAVTLLPDPVLVELYAQPTLLSHGDQLCTADVKYLEFRTLSRSQAFQQQFLAQPLAQRKQVIKQLRSQSEQNKAVASDEIMDVTVQAVLEWLREYDYPRLIHGHTHRPAKHIHHLDDQQCQRWVLGDWHQRARIIRLGIHYQQLLEIALGERRPVPVNNNAIG